MRSFKPLPTWLNLILLLLIVLGGMRIKDWFVDANRDFVPELPTEAMTLLMGDSHTVKLMDPELFDRAVNLGMSGEFVYYSYFKLKKLLASGVQPRKVILSLSYHSLATFPFFGGAEMNKRYHLLVDKQFYHRMFRYEDIHQSTLARFLGDIWAQPILLGQDIAEYHELRADSTIPWLGAYEPKEDSKIGKRRSLKAALRRHYSKFGLPTGISKAKVLYLEDLARLCEENGIELWLVNTPVHADYLEGVPPKFMEAVDRIGKELEKDGIRYLNLSRMPFADDEFYDYDHLNRKGSLRFSSFLSAMVEGGISSERSQPAY